jgi:succinate-semialdehyde dehydrogenase / glutarate-semialdehyde dehydrogenase
MTFPKKLDNENLLKTDSFINGQWVKGIKTFDVINPSTGNVIAQVADCGKDETQKAIDAAHKAFPEWSSKSGKERSAILRKWYELIIKHKEDLGVIMTAEQGKPVKEAIGEVAYGAAFVEWFAEEAKRVYGETIPSTIPGSRMHVIKQPVGVCGMITPWNFPSAMITRKAPPALAAGCTVVIKPPEATPLSALALAELAKQAGFPDGVLNIVTSSDSKTVGKLLCESEKVRKVSFTGSTKVGKILMEQCAGTVKKLSLELGGNAPFIVFDDADIDEAVKGAMMGKFRNCGQVCIAPNRFYVQDSVYDEFAEKLAEKIKRIKVGDGFEDGSDIGPLINKGGVEKVQEHIDNAVKHGAKVKVGGKAHEKGGNFFEPTLIVDMDQDMQIACDETFGPVAALFRFKDEQEVIEKANDTIYGLASYFYARDLGRVMRVAEALEYGMVGVNSGTISTEVAPFGGVKQSGLGREGSKYGIEEFVEVKYILLGGINS